MPPREEPLPQPPAPPQFQRRLRFGWTQVIGVSLLALLPLAALTGVLGTTEAETSARSGPLSLAATYPATIHYKGSHTVVLDLRNEGAQALRDVRVRFDHAYLSRFSGLQFTPQATRLDEQHAEVSLGEIEAGATRRVVLELQASEYGRPRGNIVAVAADTAEARVQLSTLVLP